MRIVSAPRRKSHKRSATERAAKYGPVIIISKGTKAAAAEAAVTAAEAIAVADFEEANRLAAEFEALVGGASPWRSLRRPNPGTPCASAGSYKSGSGVGRPALSIALKI
jgi:hypothetical protein